MCNMFGALRMALQLTEVTVCYEEFKSLMVWGVKLLQISAVPDLMLQNLFQSGAGRTGWVEFDDLGSA